MLRWLQWIFLFLPLFFSCTPKKRGGAGAQFISTTEVESNYLDQYAPNVDVVLENDFVTVETPMPEPADYVEVTVGGDTYQTCTEETVFPREIVANCEGELTCDAEAKVCSSENGGTCSESAEITFVMDESDPDDDLTVELEQSDEFTAVVSEYETRRQRAEALQEKACKISEEIDEAKLDDTMSFVAAQAGNICEMHICSVILSLDEFEDQILDLMNQEPSEEAELGEDPLPEEDELSVEAIIGIALGSTAVVAAAIGMGVGLSPKDKQKKKLSVLKDDPNLDQIKALKKALRENMLRSDQELENKAKSKAQVDAELAAARTQLAETNGDNAGLKERVGELEAKQLELGDQIDVLTVENGDLRRVTAENLQEIEGLRTELQAAKEANLEADKEMEKLKGEHAEILKAERAKTQAQIAALESSNKTLTAENKQQLERLKAMELELGKMAVLETRLGELETSLAQSEEARVTAEERAATLTDKIGELELFLSSVEAQNKIDAVHAKQDLDLLKIKLQKQKAALNKAQKSALDEGARAKRLEADLAEKARNLESSQRVASDLKQQLGQVQKLSKEQEAEIERLKQDVVDANVKAEDAIKAKMVAVDAELTELRKRANTIGQMGAANHQLKLQLTKVTQEKTKMEKQLAEHKRNEAFFDKMMKDLKLSKVPPAERTAKIQAWKKTARAKATATQFVLDTDMANGIRAALGKRVGAKYEKGKKMNSVAVVQLAKDLAAARKKADQGWRVSGAQGADISRQPTGTLSQRLRDAVNARNMNTVRMAEVVRHAAPRLPTAQVADGGGSSRASEMTKLGFGKFLTSENPQAYNALIEFIMDLTKAGIENMGSVDRMVENDWNLD